MILIRMRDLVPNDKDGMCSIGRYFLIGGGGYCTTFPLMRYSEARKMFGENNIYGFSFNGEIYWHTLDRGI